MNQLDLLQNRPDPLLDGLNPEQAAAVAHGEGPLLVLAGAGSGKTRVITHRIAHLVQRHGVAPWRILAVTFSNKAAGEMRHRVGELLGQGAEDLWLGTFHSIGVRLLRRIGQHAGLSRSFTIYDRDDQLKMLKRSMKALNISDKVFKPRNVAAYIDRAKNRCLLPADPTLERRDIQERKSAEIYARYEADMRAANAVDFGDLLMVPVQIFTEQPLLLSEYARRFQHILVDEFQDTNHAQYALLKLLSSEHGNLCVVGDDDQSIYSWRGAEIDNILNFPDAFAGTRVVRLERNYRSTEIVLAASGAVVSKNRTRHAKTLWTASKGGEKVVVFHADSDRDEADWVARRIEALRSEFPLGEFAVFYRTNAQSRVLEASMSRFRLPYILVGGLRFYERAEVKDLLAYCRLLVNEDDAAGWLRVINTPRRGIGDTTVALVEQVAAARGLSLPRASLALLASDDRLRARKPLAAFEALIADLRERVRDMPAHTAGHLVLERSGMRDALLADGSPEAESRLENLGELLSAMKEHAEGADDPGLAGFLEQVALVADVDRLADRNRAVALMTMHSAKGLEYDVTFVVGMEEGLVPHETAVREGSVDEERRLLYVAMTRARKRMHLSCAGIRYRFGTPDMSNPSPFLDDIPEEVIRREGATPRRAVGGSFGHGDLPWTRKAPAPSGQSSRTTGRFGSASAAPAPVSQRPEFQRAVLAASRAEAARAQANDEPVFEREDTDALAPGDKVRHVRFGQGEVMDVAGYGEMARVTVLFARAGVKKLVARFLTRA